MLSIVSIALGSNVMLRWPMLSIFILAICSLIHYCDPYTKDMLVTTHKKQLKRNKSNIKKMQKEEIKL
jgi:hypothetical protein